MWACLERLKIKQILISLFILRFINETNMQENLQIIKITSENDNSNIAKVVCISFK